MRMAAEDPLELSPPDPSLRPRELEVGNTQALRVTLLTVRSRDFPSASLSPVFLPFVLCCLCEDDKREEERDDKAGEE